MRIFRFLFSFIAIFLITLTVLPGKNIAIAQCSMVVVNPSTKQPIYPPNTLSSKDSQATIIINGINNQSGSPITKISTYCTTAAGTIAIPNDTSVQNLGDDRYLSVINNPKVLFTGIGTRPCWSSKITITGLEIKWLPRIDVVNQNGIVICKIENIAVLDTYMKTENCLLTANPSVPQAGQTYSISVSNLPDTSHRVSNLKLEWRYPASRVSGWDHQQTLTPSGTNAGPMNMTGENYSTIVEFAVTGSVDGTSFGYDSALCRGKITIGVSGFANTTPGAGLSATQICSFVTGPDNQKCVDCFAIPGVYTPFGCIETDPQKFISKILRIAIGIAGGIAFLMIIYGGFVIMTSAGNPEKLTSGKEILTSAISGLLLIIFSVVILKIIGVDILGIPGLG